MPRVKFKKFGDRLDLFDPHYDYLQSTFSIRGLFDRRRFFSPVLYAFLIVGFGVLFALFTRIGKILLVTEILFFTYLYFRTRSIAHGIKFKRTYDEKIIEGRELVVKYKLHNFSSFGCENIFFRDHFTGSEKGIYCEFIENIIAPGKSYESSYSFLCDGGMGIRKLGPLIILVRDFMGIFQFQVEYEDKLQVEVLPQIIDVVSLQYPDSIENASLGLKEAPFSGNSVNFLGAREYVPGDPPRRVSWRLSAKSGKLIVKEFEKMVSSDVTFILDINPIGQMGKHHSNSWDLMKLILISILKSRENGLGANQLISQGIFAPFDFGKSHIEFLIKKISSLFPYEFNAEDLAIEKSFVAIPYGSTVIHVYSSHRLDMDRYFSWMRKFFANNIRVMSIVVDPTGFLKDENLISKDAFLGTNWGQAQKTIQRIKKHNLGLEMPTFVVNKEDSVFEILNY